MYKIAVLALLLISIPLGGLAGPLTVVISPTGKQLVDDPCREALATALGQLDLKVLPKDADAVTGDLVVNVTVHTDGDTEECNLITFVTPSGEKLADIEKSAKSRISACREAAAALKGKIGTPLKKLIDQGLPHVVVLRWTKGLQPAPAMSLGSFLKTMGIRAKPVVQSGTSCTFRFASTEPQKVLDDKIRTFLIDKYRVSREPPNSLPRARRTYMFFLKKK